MKHTPYKIIPHSEKWECIYDSEENHVACVESNKANDIVHTVNMHQSLINTCQDVLNFLERTNQKDTNIYRQVEVNLSQAERK